jgi:hypothetical protein
VPDLDNRQQIDEVPWTPLHAYKRSRRNWRDPDCFDPTGGRPGGGPPHPARPRFFPVDVTGPDAPAPMAGRPRPRLPETTTGDNPPRQTYDGTAGAGRTSGLRAVNDPLPLDDYAAARSASPPR